MLARVTSDLLSFMAAPEDALPELLPGHQFRTADREPERRRNWPVGLRDPHERRSHRGPSEGRGPPHEPARHSSLQPAEGATEATGAAQRQPRRRVHLLGTEQLHEAGRQRPRLQQPQTDEPTAAWTGTLHHLSDQNAKIWWTVWEGNGDGQVNISSVGVPYFKCIGISKQSSLEVAGTYISLFTTAVHDQLFSNVAVERMEVLLEWTGDFQKLICMWTVKQRESDVKSIWFQSLLPPAWRLHALICSPVQTKHEQFPFLQAPIILAL